VYQSDLGDGPLHLDFKLFQLLLRERVKVKVPGTFGFAKEGIGWDGSYDRLCWRINRVDSARFD